MARRNWERDELIRVLLLYYELPFGQLHSRNPRVRELAEEIGRTANAVALKMVNFASLDPTIQQKGMANTSALDKEVWHDFFTNIDSYVSEEARATRDDGKLRESPLEPLELDVSREETERVGWSSSRRGQQRFRNAVLASYDNRCAISGIADTRLLVASHIAPWAANVGRRLDPRNGICLNCLLDKAFDVGVISITPEYRLVFSPSASTDDIEKISKNGVDFRRPNRFLPDPDLLRQHGQRFGFC